MSSQVHKGEAFERRVGRLFELLGYQVERDRLLAGRQVDLVLRDSSGPLKRDYIVECKDQARPVSTSQFDAFVGRLIAARKAGHARIRGVMVSSVGFVKEVVAQSEYHDIEVVSITDLEKSLIDFGPYVSTLKASLSTDDTLKFFVQPSLVREHRQVEEPARPLLEEWMVDSQANQLTLLGDYGTGKTTLLKSVALEAARSWELNVGKLGARSRLPVFIDLREYGQAASIKQVVLDMLDRHGIRASYAAFEFVLSSGQVLLILDGFDEMASKASYHLTLASFKEITRLSAGRAKVILSCRTHYFTNSLEVQSLHNGRQLPSSRSKLYTDLYREIAAKRNFWLVFLQDFAPDQVKEYLNCRCGTHASEVARFIRGTYNLAELSRRPVLLDMIVTSEGAIRRKNTAISAGLLYQIYTDIWLSTNDWTCAFQMEQKSELLESFALRVSTESRYRLHFEEIPKLVRDLDGNLDRAMQAMVETELRRASFLVRDAEGHYRFSHRSFWEFFYAKFLLRSASSREVRHWETGFFTKEVYRFLFDLLPEDEKAHGSLIAWVSDESVPWQSRANATKCLGAIDSALARTSLRRLAQGNDGTLRRYAVTALGRIGNAEDVDLMVEIAEETFSSELRSNALIALSRIDSPGAVEAFAGALKTVLSESDGTGSLLWPLLFSAHHLSKGAVEACVPLLDTFLSPQRARLVRACLSICERGWGADAERFCSNVLRSTQSPAVAIHALTLLGPSAETNLVAHAVKLLEWNIRSKGAGDWIRKLKGFDHPLVLNCLKNLAQNERRHTEAVIEVLASDYPGVVAENAPQWSAKGRPHTFRIAVASVVAEYSPSSALPLLLDLLAPREKVSAKLKALKIIFRRFPDLYPGIVLEFWKGESVPITKRIALELLFQIDREAAVGLALKSLSDPRNGTRVYMCALLASVFSLEATVGLLQVLESDESRWARLQAIRSLVVPGRTLTHEDLNHALKSEKDEEIMSEARQFLNV